MKNDRATALVSLIAKVEAGHVNPYEFEPWEAVLGYELTSSSEVSRFTDSLDAVARLEAHLFARWSLCVASPDPDFEGWSAKFTDRENYSTVSVDGHLTEARARLLAVLRVMLHEAEAAQ